MKISPFYTILFSFLISCDKVVVDPPVSCTEEFRYISIEVDGDSLTQFYTIRKLNSDTIRPTPNAPIFDNFYEVLNDSYSAVLKNKSEQFQFIGVINDSTLVKLDYEIAADECHIFKISGPSYISL